MVAIEDTLYEICIQIYSQDNFNKLTSLKNQQYQALIIPESIYHKAEQTLYQALTRGGQTLYILFTNHTRTNV